MGRKKTGKEERKREWEILAGYPLRGKSSVCVMCLKSRIMIYFKHITHTVVIITHYKCKGSVIISNQIFQAVNV